MIDFILNYWWLFGIGTIVFGLLTIMSLIIFNVEADKLIPNTWLLLSFPASIIFGFLSGISWTIFLCSFIANLVRWVK